MDQSNDATGKDLFHAFDDETEVFAELDFFAAAHRAFSALDIFFLAAADITFILAETDFFTVTTVMRPADFFCASAFLLEQSR